MESQLHFCVKGLWYLWTIDFAVSIGLVSGHLGFSCITTAHTIFYASQAAPYCYTLFCRIHLYHLFPA